MTDLVLPFSDPRAENVALSGGKGASLAKLTAAGFNVPTGLIITTGAYRLFADSAAEVLAAMADFDPSDVGDLAARSQALIADLSGLPLPEPIRTDIAAVLDTLEIGKSYAVRSSSTLEDLAEAAFAGMHDTFLNVSGIEEVEAKTVACFASLWADRAFLYRQQRGFDHGQAEMAVVVQQLVHARTAGVAFSLNPVTGHPDQAVINANFGLGESVVSGESDVDQYVYNLATSKLDEFQIAESRHVIRAENGAGTRTDEIDGGEPCLDKEQIVAVAGLAARAAKFYCYPQDIEWAYGENEALFLLQSRNVTQLPPYWTRDESAERFPNVVTPLTWDLVEDGFHKSLKHSLNLMGMPPFNGVWFGLHDNYVYGNETIVRLYKGMAPDLPDDIGLLLKQLPSLFEKFSWAVELPSIWSANLDRYLLELGRLQAVPLSDLAEEELWDHVLEINDLGTWYFLPNIAISMAHHLLASMMKRMCVIAVGEGKGEALFSLLLSGTETRTAQINRQIFDLAQQVRDNEILRALLETTAARKVIETDALAQFPVFREAFQRFLALFGNREIDFDPYHPSWGEAPWIVLDQVCVVARSEEEFFAAEELERRLKVRAAEHDFLVKMPAEVRPYAVDLLRLTRTYTELDDLEHFETSRLAPAMRRVLLVLGGKLAERGVTTVPADIWFAQRATLDAAVRNERDHDWAALKTEVAVKKECYLRNKLRTPKWALADIQDGPGDEAPDVLSGLSGSHGSAEGEVFLLRGPEDFADFPNRAVLVARTTSPAWTPLFYSASAVVTESGGPLSHGAVTARELGKPAVMAVRNVLTILKTGDRVRVDGAAGKVYRLG